MADKRMFAKTIVLSDAFLDMPMSARCLYFTLSMVADDDGFVNQPRGVMRQCGASEDDMKILISKKFVIVFESGVIVIKHWRINNYLRSDRYKETVYKDEKALLETDENGGYHVKDVGIPSIGIPSIDKNSIDKNRLDIHSAEADEILGYLNSKVGSHFRNVEANRRFISGRLNEGYTVEDFKKVIDKKCAEWMRTDFQQFLRPKTLFAPSNFESYLNAPPKIKTVSCVVEIPDYIRDQIDAQAEHETAEKNNKAISDIKAEIEQMKGQMHE